MKGFEELLESTLQEMANPEPPPTLEDRLLKRVLSHEATASPIATASSTSNFLTSIWENLRELVSPQKLPPLVLESQPVPVIDLMATERSSHSMMGAVLAHAVILLVIACVVEARVGTVRPQSPMQITTLDTPPPKTLSQATTAGGGGGQHGPTPVTQGHLPKFADQQIVPPMAPPVDPPKIPIEPTVELQKDLKMADNALPNLGMPNSPLVGASMGEGRGTGIGSGYGNGVGPGYDGNTGGGLKHVGGSVSEPRVLFQPEPLFSEEARKAKFSGSVLVYLWVDEHGNPTHVRVAHGVGLGLDEKAVEAVQQYKFKPAMQNGKPVTVEMYVDVNFQIL